MRIPITTRKKFFTYQPTFRYLLILVFVVVGLFVGVVPAVRATWNLIQENRSVSAEITTLNQKITLLSSLDYVSIQKNLSDLFAALPTEKSPQGLFATLEGLAAQAGTGLADVTLSVGGIASQSANTSSVHVSGARVVQFAVSIEGTMEQTQRFFQLASSVRRLLGIRSFDMAITSSGIIATKVSMNTYYAPLPSVFGGVATSLEPLSEQEESIIAKIVLLPNMSQTAQLPPAAIGPGKSDPFSL